MKELFKKSMLVILVMVSFTLLSSCTDDKTPSEEELVSMGLSLQEALPSFKTLEDNYTYRKKLWQTNGEDWFSYHLVKLDDHDIYDQAFYYYGNVGWQYEDEAFIYDTNKAYTIYLYDNDQYTIYRKYKYTDTDEEFTKHSYAYNVQGNLEEASILYYDFSFLTESMFEYYVFDDQSNIENKVWRVKEDILFSSSFKESLLVAVHQNIDSIDHDYFDFVYLYVDQNQVTSLVFAYWYQTLQHHYRFEIHFSYDDVSFDEASLTQGFTPYHPE
ncbi:MAG: hypothetical protein RBQ97_01340 [Acholeplasma sp.]|jgi:hypothetical protein|nr:hypothetical protein [Acholeplasma sp.]